MPSSRYWSTGQEHGVDTLAREAALGDIAMPSPADWGACDQHIAKDPRQTVPETTTSTSGARKPIPLSDDGDADGSVPDLFGENAWDKCNETNLFDLSCVQPDEDEELLGAQPNDGRPSLLTLEKLRWKQKTDKFLRKVLSRQYTTKESKFFEDTSD